MDNTQKVFAVVSALAGIGGLYFAWKKSNQGPPQINILPQLSSPSYAPGQPTANGASVPAFYASPFQLPPQQVQQPQQVPYQVYNMPPSHVQSKQAAQQTAAATPPPASGAQPSPCGCGGNDAHCDNYGPSINVPSNFGPSETRNINGVGLRPILTPQIGATDSIYSPATAFNLATQQTVPSVYNMSNQGVTLIGNVPSVSDLVH